MVKLAQNHFLPYPFQFVMHHLPVIQCRIVRITYDFVKYIVNEKKTFSDLPQFFHANVSVVF
jgi:hypothetical protein